MGRPRDRQVGGEEKEKQVSGCRAGEPLRTPKAERSAPKWGVPAFLLLLTRPPRGAV